MLIKHEYRLGFINDFGSYSFLPNAPSVKYPEHYCGKGVIYDQMNEFGLTPNLRFHLNKTFRWILGIDRIQALNNIDWNEALTRARVCLNQFKECKTFNQYLFKLHKSEIPNIPNDHAFKSILDQAKKIPRKFFSSKYAFIPNDSDLSIEGVFLQTNFIGIVIKDDSIVSYVNTELYALLSILIEFLEFGLYIKGSVLRWIKHV